MKCNATWTPAVETDDVVTYRTRSGLGWSYWPDHISDGMAVVRRGDRLLRLDLHTLTCAEDDPGKPLSHCTEGWHDSGMAVWHDDTPGATSHSDNTPAVHSDRCCGVRAEFEDDTPPADVCPDCRDYDHRGTCLGERCACDKFPSCGGTGDRTKEDDMNDPRIKRFNDALKMVGREPLPESTVRLVLNSIEGTGDRPAVTDAEWNAAIRAYSANGVDDDTAERLMAALEAAARAQTEQRSTYIVRDDPCRVCRHPKHVGRVCGERVFPGKGTGRCVCESLGETHASLPISKPPADVCDDCNIDLGHNWHIVGGDTHLCDDCYVKLAYPEMDE